MFYSSTGRCKCRLFACNISSGRGQIGVSLQAGSKARYRCCMSDQVEVVGQANSIQVYKYISCTLSKAGS